MYFRCSHCHESTWIRSLVPGMVERQVDCQDCGHGHDLSRSGELGDTGKKQYDTAQDFSTRNGVDLPTAYSVLLGLMTLAEARETDNAKKEETKKERPRHEPTPSVEIETAPDEPAPLGRKNHRWSVLQRKTKPKKEQKVTIHVERDMAKERRRITPGQLVLVLALAGITIGLSGRHAYRTYRGLVEEGRDAQQTTAASAAAVENAAQEKLNEARENQSAVPDALRAELQHDSDGVLTQVSGPNPMSVLLAFCKDAEGTSHREPLELAQAAPPSPDERYGVFRDFARLETNHAIRISQDRETKRWFAGNGRGPVPTRTAPARLETIRRAALNER